jgi:hypothetical protein
VRERERERAGECVKTRLRRLEKRSECAHTDALDCAWADTESVC